MDDSLRSPFGPTKGRSTRRALLSLLRGNDEVKHAGILIDCGLFQGAEVSGSGSSFEQLQIDFPISHIKALVVTHVHIDHVGRIPYLLAAGFDGPIICTEPSAHLLPLVLEDAVKIGFTRNARCAAF
jgi:Cft2 family RNA processing exonuclease